jgi:hypothetical protein
MIGVSMPQLSPIAETLSTTFPVHNAKEKEA